MAKVSFISPKILFDKFNEFIQKPNKQKTATDVAMDKTNAPNKTVSKNKISKQPSIDEERKLVENDFLENLENENPAKLNLTLKDVKIISTSLIYFQKYLRSKGQNQKAEEVAQVDKNLFDFIQAMEIKKKSA